jgi:hypothetical protein
MRLKGIFFVIVIFMVFNAPVFACGTEVFKVRPVTIKVIDKSTGLPLEGIPVYYVLKSYWDNRIFFILRNPEGTHTRKFQAMEEYLTNAQGEVMIREHEVRLNKWKCEEIEKEQIFINLGNRLPISEKEPREHKYIILQGAVIHGKRDHYNPIAKYKGFFICSTTWDMDPKYYGGNKGEIANVLWNGRGLLKKEPETFVVELERWEEE